MHRQNFNQQWSNLDKLTVSHIQHYFVVTSGPICGCIFQTYKYLQVVYIYIRDFDLTLTNFVVSCFCLFVSRSSRQINMLHNLSNSLKLNLELFSWNLLLNGENPNPDFSTLCHNYWDILDDKIISADSLHKSRSTISTTLFQLVQASCDAWNSCRFDL